MSKGGIKKKNREPSARSRAARREASPSLDAARTIREVSSVTPNKTDLRSSVLAIHHNAGISKKSSHRRSVKTSKQRRRQERGINRAEAVANITARKIEKSLAQENSIKERKIPWDDVNKTSKVNATKFGFNLLSEDNGEDDVNIAVTKKNVFASIPSEIDMDAGVEIIDDATPTVTEQVVREVVEMKDEDEEIL